MLGVPDNEPSAEEKVNPADRLGFMLKVLLPKPPEAATGINAWINTSCSSVLEAMDCTADKAGGSSTVNRNVSVSD